MTKYNLTPVEMTDFRPIVPDFVVVPKQPSEGQAGTSRQEHPIIVEETVVEEQENVATTTHERVRDIPEAELSQEEDAANCLLSLSSSGRTRRTASNHSSQGSSSQISLNSCDQQNVMNLQRTLLNEAACVSPPYSKRRTNIAMKVPASIPESSVPEYHASESSSEMSAVLSVSSYNTTLRGKSKQVLKPNRFPPSPFGTQAYMDYVLLNFGSKTECDFLRKYGVGDKEPSSYSKFVILTKPGALPLGFKFPEVLVPEEEGGFDFIASVKKIFESVNEDVLLNVKPANKVRRLPSSSRLSWSLLSYFSVSAYLFYLEFER